MKHETRVVDDQFVATFSDELSFADQGSFRDTLKMMVESGKRKFVIELSRLQSIDSAGLGMFMVAGEEAKKGNWSLVLRSPQGQVKKMLELAKFGDMIAIEG